MAGALCRCGSGFAYPHCCAPFHLGAALPLTALALMRSRYAAFCMQDGKYLLASWAAATRPLTLDFSDNSQHWQKLEIIRCEQGEATDVKGSVEFNAYFTEADSNWVLNERSRFIKVEGRWFYLDGNVKVSAVANSQADIGKNTPCPCGSGKKFKRCCGASDARK